MCEAPGPAGRSRARGRGLRQDKHFVFSVAWELFSLLWAPKSVSPCQSRNLSAMGKDMALRVLLAKEKRSNLLLVLFRMIFTLTKILF